VNIEIYLCRLQGLGVPLGTLAHLPPPQLCNVVEMLVIAYGSKICDMKWPLTARSPVQRTIFALISLDFVLRGAPEGGIGRE
jgi:hypothetical protein